MYGRYCDSDRDRYETRIREFLETIAASKLTPDAILKEFKTKFAEELSDTSKRGILLIALVTNCMSFGDALKIDDAFSPREEARQALLTENDTDNIESSLQTLSTNEEIELERILSTWAPTKSQKLTLTTRQHVKNLALMLAGLPIALLASTGGSYCKDFRVLAGYPPLQLTNSTGALEIAGEVAGSLGIFWLFLLFWTSAPKMYTYADRLWKNVTISIGGITFGGASAAPSGEVANSGFDNNMKDILHIEIPSFFDEYDLPMLASFLANASLGTGLILELISIIKFVFRTIKSQAGWMRALMIFQLVLGLILSFIANYGFYDSGKGAIGVKNIDNEYAKSFMSILLNLAQLVMMLSPILFSSPYATYKYHQTQLHKITIIFWMTYMGLFGGVMDGVLAKLALDETYPRESAETIAAGAIATISASLAFCQYGPGVATSFKSYWETVKWAASPVTKKMGQATKCIKDTGRSMCNGLYEWWQSQDTIMGG